MTMSHPDDSESGVSCHRINKPYANPGHPGRVHILFILIFSCSRNADKAMDKATFLPGTGHRYQYTATPLCIRRVDRAKRNFHSIVSYVLTGGEGLHGDLLGRLWFLLCSFDKKKERGAKKSPLSVTWTTRNAVLVVLLLAVAARSSCKDAEARHRK